MASEEWQVRETAEGVHPRATMQKHEREGVAGGASWKFLKIKVQICRDRTGGVRQEAEKGIGEFGGGESRGMLPQVLPICQWNSK